MKERLSLETNPSLLPNKENNEKPPTSPDKLAKPIPNPSSSSQPSTDSTETISTPEASQQFAQLSIKPRQQQQQQPQPDTNQLAMARHIQTENKRKAMLLKIEVQKKARELIEKQIKDQKLLLEKFKNAKTAEEKTQILALIKKISEAMEKEKEILNSDMTSSSKPKMESHARVQPAPHHLLKLNNKRLNTTSFLKTGTPTSPKPPPAQQTSSPQSYFNFSQVSVDNRPRKLALSGIKSANERTNILNFINALGVRIDQVDQIETSQELADAESSSVVITFATRKDAEFVRTRFFKKELF